PLSCRNLLGWRSVSNPNRNFKHGPAFRGWTEGRLGPCRPFRGERPNLTTLKLRQGFRKLFIKKRRGGIGGQSFNLTDRSRFPPIEPLTTSKPCGLGEGRAGEN